MGSRLPFVMLAALAAACSSSKEGKPEITPSAQEAKARPQYAGELPRIDDGGAVVPLDRVKPETAIFIAADGTLGLMTSTGEDWPKEIAKQKPVAFDELRALIVGGSGRFDDPPPPEEEEEDEDESGGTGTMVTLEEGKMGKKESERAEGQYKMKKNQDDPQLARQQAIEQARKAGILGSPALQQGGAFATLTGTGDYGEAVGPLASTVGLPVDVLPHHTPVVFADPKAKATVLVDVLAVAGGTLAVKRAGGVGLFRVGFSNGIGMPSMGGSFADPLPEAWVEAHLDATNLHLLVGNLDKRYEIPLVNDKVDFARLAAKLDEIKQLPELAKTKTDLFVDVLAHGDMPVQKLVDVLVAVDAARARPRIGTSPTPAADRKLKSEYGIIGVGGGYGGGDGFGDDPDRGGMRGRAADVPQVRIGQPVATGDLDKAIIRRYIKRNLQKITYCYEKILLAKPEIEGTVNVQFFITPNGAVESASANGVDAEVSSCVAEVIKQIQFPKPKGGGGVQVNYPFTFRPSGG
jgi:hypothetical protein